MANEVTDVRPAGTARPPRNGDPGARGERRQGDVQVAAPMRPSTFGELRFERQPAVPWFSPGVLTRSALRVAGRSAFGDYLDKRELQGGLAADPLLHHADRDEIWIDYISDTGDGFEPTYSVAWLAAREKLAVDGVELPRADIMVLGGDEVYPVASVDEYDNRFVGPYAASLPWLTEHNPEMYLVAGNHDWYDGLTTFIRLFCQGGWIGARRTRQTRSYFALQLPHGWWLWGLDVQFESYLDEPQLQYFTRAAELMRAGDRVILCTAVPSWTKVVADPSAFHKLGFVEERLIGPANAKLVLTLSGDSHHYAHYVGGSSDTHKITAGGGGAFLHGTNDLHDTVELRPSKNPRVEPQTFELGACYPDRRTSRWLALRAVALPLRNPSFTVIPAVLYALLGLAAALGLRVSPEPNPLDQPGLGFGWFEPLVGLGRNPLSVLLLLLLFGATYGFAAPPDRWMAAKTHAKAGMGLAHTVLHVVAFTTATWLAVRFCQALDLQGARFTLTFLAVLAILGAVLGSLVFGGYLAFCCAVLKAHGNEAFSAMGHTGYKNFLRLHIDADGALTVYPLAIRRAATKWRLDPDNTPEASWLAPATEHDAPEARFIERPFTIAGRPEERPRDR